MHRAGRGVIARQQMKRRPRGGVADWISVAGHSRGLRQTPIEACCGHSAHIVIRPPRYLKHRGRETPQFPHPGPAAERGGQGLI
jgi:hypothetical protein